MDILEKLRAAKIIAIVRGIESRYIPSLASALADGGIKFIEVTFQQNKPETWFDTCAAISAIKQNDICVGAGTVMTVPQLKMAREAGAEYFVAPNIDESVIRRACELGMASFPGAFTPTEIAAAHRAGATAVKLFPASSLGASYVKAVRAPLSNIEIIAVGGITIENARDFIRAGCIGIGVSSGLVDKNLLMSGNTSEITARAKKYMEAVKI